MGVFESEAFEVDLRRSVWRKVLVFVWIEGEVGRIENPKSIGDRCNCGCDIQVIEEDVVGLVLAIAIAVFVNRDSIDPFDTTKSGWLWLFVVHDAPIGIAALRLQSRWFRVLPVLHQPHAARVVESGHQGLANQRFVQHQVPAVAIGDLKTGKNSIGRERGGWITSVVRCLSEGLQAIERHCECGREEDAASPSLGAREFIANRRAGET